MNGQANRIRHETAGLKGNGGIRTDNMWVGCGVVVFGWVVPAGTRDSQTEKILWNWMYRLAEILG